jgi:chromosome segregation ATPase
MTTNTTTMVSTVDSQCAEPLIIPRMREDNQRLREEVDRLKSAVRRSLGQQLDQFGAADLGARIDELTAENQRLQDELAQAQARVGELTSQLREAQDDLAGARTSIRRLIRAGNHP